jgi:hypothetical protein
MALWKRYAWVLLGGIACVALIHIVSFFTFLISPPTFYYRSWEWFEDFPYRSSAIDPVWTGPEQGDLSPTQWLLFKHQRHTRASTDRFGFRSVPLAAAQYPILVTGDSTIWGSGLSDEHTLPWRLAERLGVPVYNGSRTNLSNTLRHPQLRQVKTVIDGRTERKIRGTVFQRYGDETRQFTPLTKNDLPEWKTYLEVNPKRYSPISRIPLYLEQMAGDWTAYREGRADDYYLIWPHTTARGHLSNAVKAIVARHRAFKRRGIRYIFLPIPAKQTLYKDGLDATTRGYLHELHTALVAQGVETVDLITPFEDQKAQGLFQRYDTHWNELGTHIAADAVAEHLRLKAP